VSAEATAGNTGTTEVRVKTGSNLIQQTHQPALTVAPAPVGCRPLFGLRSPHRRFKFCLAGLEVTQALL
jgi:hypothetical protein